MCVWCRCGAQLGFGYGTTRFDIARTRTRSRTVLAHTRTTLRFPFQLRHLRNNAVFIAKLCRCYKLPDKYIVRWLSEVLVGRRNVRMLRASGDVVQRNTPPASKHAYLACTQRPQVHIQVFGPLVDERRFFRPPPLHADSRHDANQHGHHNHRALPPCPARHHNKCRHAGGTNGQTHQRTPPRHAPLSGEALAGANSCPVHAAERGAHQTSCSAECGATSSSPAPPQSHSPAITAATDSPSHDPHWLATPTHTQCRRKKEKKRKKKEKIPTKQTYHTLTAHHRLLHPHGGHRQAVIVRHIGGQQPRQPHGARRLTRVLHGDGRR